MIAVLQIIQALEAKMVTFKKSRGRTIVIDKKTGKPRAPAPRMSVSQKIRQSKSKRVKVSRRTKGAQKP